MDAAHVCVLVLAAGLGSRFAGGHKLLAPLDGRPVLQHVLDTVASLRPAGTLVVLGHGVEEVEAAIRWRGERRVVNPDPGRGLSSSIQLGLEALEATEPATTEAALIVLGDQPRLDPAVVARLLVAADQPPVRPTIVPRYGRDGAPNPVLLRREGWPLAWELTGDRGFGPLLSGREGLVREVPVSGANPDVDTTADLAALEREGR